MTNDARAAEQAGESEDLIPFGNAPRPTTNDEFARRLVDALQPDPAASGWSLRGAAPQVSAELQGADVASLVVDVTGLVVEQAPGASTREPLSEPPPADRTTTRLRTEPAALHRAQLRARPIHVQGVPVTIEAEGVDLPLDWVHLAGGGLAIDVPVDQPERLRTGSAVRLRVRADVAPVVRAMAGAARPGLAAEGIRLERERLSLRQLGPRRVRFEGRARVRWKIFRLRATVSGLLAVDEHLVLGLSDFRLRVSNPLLNLAFHGFFRELAAELQQSVDLNDSLAPWTIRHLRMRAGRRVEVDLELRPR